MPRTSSNPLSVSVGVQTHPGRERAENQDRVTRAASSFGDLFVLADGVGGYQGGAEAAQAVVDGYAAYLKDPSDLKLHEVLQQATNSINAKLNERLAASSAQQGLGSTVVLCVLHGDRATYAHAGDSRIYMLRDSRLVQLSRDHSVMERMIAHGVLSPESGRDHPDANALTRALGLLPEVSLDIADINLQAGDALLLCSDGLWAYASHSDMETVVTTDDLSTAAVAEALLNLALEGGGGDNISLQFLRFSATHTPEAAIQPKRKPGTLARVSSAASALVLAGSTAGLFLWNQQHPFVRQAVANTSQAVERKGAVANSAQKMAAGSSPIGPPLATQVPVTVVTTGAAAKASWARHLHELTYLQPRQHIGSDACLALRLPSDTLFYLHSRRDLAIKVQQDLASSHLQVSELPRGAASLCGDAELIAMPGYSEGGQHVAGSVTDQFGKARSGIEAVTGTPGKLSGRFLGKP